MANKSIQQDETELKSSLIRKNMNADASITNNALKFDFSSTNNLNTDSVHYRQRILSQRVTETTNSNDILEWKTIQFPDQCCSVAMSPNDRFLVAECGTPFSRTPNSLIVYDLQTNQLFKPQLIHLKWAYSTPFYWVNDNLFCVQSEQDYRTGFMTIHLVDAITHRCFVLDQSSGGEVFAVNNKQFVLISKNAIKCFKLPHQTNSDSVTSLTPYHVISLDSRCAYKQCVKLQWVEKERAVVILPMMSSNTNGTDYDSMNDFTLSFWLLDLCSFTVIDMKDNDVFSDIEGNFDGNSMNAPRVCYNKMNKDWNWTNDNSFCVIYDTESTATCDIYHCKIDLLEDKQYAIQCSKVLPIPKEGGGSYDGEKPEWRDPYLLIHPLCHQHITVQTYSKRWTYSYGDYTSPWDKDDYEIKRWHQCTQINPQSTNGESQRYKYFTHREIDGDVLSGMLFVEAKFVHESKPEILNDWFREMQKPCTYGWDVRDSVNGNKVGFIALPDHLMKNLDSLPDKTFSGSLQALFVRFGVGKIMIFVKETKHVYILMNVKPPQYWSDIVYSTALCGRNRTVSDLIATFLCY